MVRLFKLGMGELDQYHKVQTPDVCFIMPKMV